MKKNKTIVNLLSLTSIQLLNYLLPLITMPYLIKTVGISQYGLLSFAQATMQYFILLTDYGFNILGTQQIALCKNDLAKRNRIFNQIMQAKLLLVTLSIVILTVMSLFVPKLREDVLLYVLLFGLVIGNAFFPVWFFQGIEEMKEIGLLNFLGKGTFTVGLFLFVKNPNDVYIAGGLNSLGYILTAVVSLVIIYYRYHVVFKIVPMRESYKQLRDAGHLFIANISTSFYTTTNIFFLGIVAGDTQTGYFNLANTLVRACASLAVPITQTFFPKLAVLLKQSKVKALRQINKLFVLLTIIFTIGCMVLLLASPKILTLIFNDQFEHSILYVQVMSFLPLMVAWGNIFGILIMSLFGYQKALSRIYLLGGLLSLVLMVILTLNFGGLGTAINAFITELFISLMMIFYTRNKGIYLGKELSSGGELD